MKFFIFYFIFLFANRPIYSEEYIILNNSQCKQTIYREKYIPGNSTQPGYLKVWEDDVWLPCKQKQISNLSSQQNIDNKKSKKCYRTIGSLMGGSIAGALSTKDAYSWAIPLGIVLGGGFGNAGCK